MGAAPSDAREHQHGRPRPCAHRAGHQHRSHLAREESDGGSAGGSTDEDPRSNDAACALAEVLLRQNQLDAAQTLLERTLRIERLQRESGFPSRSASLLAAVYSQKGKLQEAVNTYAEIYEQSVRAYGAEDHRPLTTAINLGFAEYRRGDLDTVRDWLEPAVEGLTRSLGAHHRLTLQATSALALVLAALPDSSPQDVERALELAKRASEGKPDDAASWSTLGKVLYRAGRMPESAEALEKALRLEPDSNRASRLLFLAMATWKMGSHDQARRHYDEAISCMAEQAPEDRSLVQNREEAALLLGILDQQVNELQRRSGTTHTLIAKWAVRSACHRLLRRRCRMRRRTKQRRATVRENRAMARQRRRRGLRRAPARAGATTCFQRALYRRVLVGVCAGASGVGAAQVRRALGR